MTEVSAGSRHRLALPNELLIWILQHTILENIHCRLTKGSGEDILWNSLVPLPQVCHVFHDICQKICEQLLGDPTPEQKGGQWHAKSPLAHARDALDHLFRFSPSRLSHFLDKDIDTCMVSLLDKNYRNSVLQMPGLLGEYEKALSSRVVRVGAVRRGFIHPRREGHFVRNLALCLEDLKSVPAFRFGNLTSPQLFHFTSQLKVECFFNTQGFLLWAAACYFNTAPPTGAFMSDPGSISLLNQTLDMLLSSREMLTSKLKILSDLGLDLHYFTRNIINDSGLIPMLDRFIARNEDDPYRVKPKAQTVLAEFGPLIQGQDSN